MTWPFRTKEPELNPPVTIGERFRYLGVEMICIRLSEFDYSFPVVIAQYIDTHGRIEEIRFPPCDWPALRAELTRGNKS